MRLLGICTVALCLTVGGAGSAAAACRQADMAGVWDLYMTVGDDFFGVGWVACYFRMNPNGVILAGGQCLDSDGTFALVGGRLTLSPSCSVIGDLNLRVGPARTQARVQAALSREKSVLVGLTVNRNTGAPSTFQAVKR